MPTKKIEMSFSDYEQQREKRQELISFSKRSIV
jgi:hypothetical protein